MPFATYLANDVLTDFIVNGTPFVQLHTENPTAAGTVGVVTGIARIDASGRFDAASGGTCTSNTDLLSSAFTAQQDVSHVSIWDAVAGGNCLYYGGATGTKTVAIGDIWRAASGQLTVTNSVS